MSRTITLEDQAASALEILRAQAAARGMPLENYLQLLAQSSDQFLGAAARSPHSLTKSEFSQWLIDLSAGMPPVPPLPADFSRADLYDDHD
jgi:hypothetical protein